MKMGKKSLVIIASHIKEEALHVMVRNQTEEKKKLSILGIQLKEIGDPRRMAFQDLTTLTGANILGRNYYAYAANAKEEDLGEAMRVQVDRKMMQLQPFQSRIAEMQETVEQLRARLEGMRVDDDERDDIINRLAALTGGMGVLKVGTNLKHERDIVSALSERALTATSLAHRTGVVPGGGAAFVHARSALDKLEMDGDEKVGVKVLRDALDAPFLQIVQNAGIESPSVAALRLEEAGPAYTFDVVKEKLVDAQETGLVDVTGVQTAVLETAVSGALMALGTNTIVFHKEPTESMEP